MGLSDSITMFFLELFKGHEKLKKILIIIVYIVVALFFIESAIGAVNLVLGKPATFLFGSKTFNEINKEVSERSKDQGGYFLLNDTIPKKSNLRNTPSESQSKSGNTFNNNATNNGYQSAGDMEVNNYYSKPERHVGENDINEVIRLNKNKLPFKVKFDNTTLEAKTLAGEIISGLKNKGYTIRVESYQPFGATSYKNDTIIFTEDSLFTIKIYPQQ